MQMTSDVEILLELPDKYLRSDASSGSGMMNVGGWRPASTATSRCRPANAAAMAPAAA